jgi:hypothetical protein
VSAVPRGAADALRRDRSLLADRMDARTREINSSNVAMFSHPRVTTDMIIDADRRTR